MPWSDPVRLGWGQSATTALLTLFWLVATGSLYGALPLNSDEIKADRPLTRDTLNAPWLLTNRQFQWTGNGHYSNYHWLNSASRVLISTSSAPLVQTAERKQFSLFDLELWPTTLTHNPRLAKVKIDPHAENQGQRSNGSIRRAPTVKRTDTHTDATKRIIAPATRSITRSVETQWVEMWTVLELMNVQRWNWNCALNVVQLTMWFNAVIGRRVNLRRSIVTNSLSCLPSLHSLVAWRSGSVVRSSHQRSYSTSSPVSTGMGNRLRAGLPPRYASDKLGQLSLAPSGIAKSSTSFNWLG